MRNEHKDKKIVFTYGTYDLIHSAHAIYLLKAKAKGDILVVGVAKNRSKLRIPNKKLPLIDEKNREELLHYFNFVDYTVLVDIDDLSEELESLRPDVFFTLENDWVKKIRTEKEKNIANKHKIKITKNPKGKIYVSASDMINRVADVKIKSKVEYFFGKTKIDLSKGDWSKKKWSGLKTDIRSDTLFFGKHTHKVSPRYKNLIGKIIKYNDINKLREKYDIVDKKIVLALGACDLLHSGHARFFQQAKNSGDILVLGIPSDRVVRKQKGAGRPVVTEYSRAELMSFFRFTDFVTIYDKEDVRPFISNLNPDIFFTIKENWNEASDNDKYFNDVKGWNGKIKSIKPQAKNLSSTKIIKKATGIRIKEIFNEELEESRNGKPLKDI